MSLEAIALGIIAFVCFGLFASGTYMLNDLTDLDADRHHPRKQRRAFASGRIAPIKGLAVGPGLMLSALPIAVVAEPWLAAVLIAYGALTICYSMYLKTRPLVDVYALAALYCVRIIGGRSSDRHRSVHLAAVVFQLPVPRIGLAQTLQTSYRKSALIWSAWLCGG